ncbi:MAG TPA: thioesterase family protein [Candidatus Elarobacter sp.]
MALEDFHFRLPIRVVFGDLDYYRHVNNARYITWCESARLDWLEAALGVPLISPRAVIMASQTYAYEKQVGYHEELVMGCRCSRLGRKSLELTYELWRGEERTGHGTSALVAFDYDANASIAVPADWRARIVAYERVAPAGA